MRDYSEEDEMRRTGKVGHPICVAVARQDDGVVDSVIVEVVEETQAICLVTVPCVNVDYVR